MTDAAKEARRAYKRKWARENPDKIRAQQDRYWSKRAEADAAAAAAAAQSEAGREPLEAAPAI